MTLNVKGEYKKDHINETIKKIKNYPIKLISS